MSRPPTEGFQKPLRAQKTKAVGLALVSEGDGYAQCSCGKSVIHRRRKVIETRMEKHVNEKHGGRAVWM